ncbi:MAG: EAL domain-containing protein [Synechococcus sp. WH 8007]|nr:EAL domain-containing protein [Synechococcus sp. WH 8007]
MASKANELLIQDAREPLICGMVSPSGWDDVALIAGAIESEYFFSDYLRRLSNAFVDLRNTIFYCSGNKDLFFLAVAQSSAYEAAKQLASNIKEYCTYSYNLDTLTINSMVTGVINCEVVGNAVDLSHQIALTDALAKSVCSMSPKSEIVIKNAPSEIIPSKIVERNKLKSQILAALDSNNVLVHLQPIYTSCGNIQGLECLARLDIEGTILYPDQFFPVLHSANVIPRLDLIVCQQACALASLISNQFNNKPLYLSVNLSGQLLSSAEHRSSLLNLLKNTHNKPSCALSFEIVEDSLDLDSKTISEYLHTLNSMGHQLYIDDFGLGFSSLDRVLRLPVSGLKLDRSLTLLIDEIDEFNLNLFGSVISQFSSSHLTVIAEGIENHQQLEWFKNNGLTLFQGFLFSKPISFSQATSFLSAESSTSNRNVTRPLPDLRIKLQKTPFLKRIYDICRRVRLFNRRN